MFRRYFIIIVLKLCLLIAVGCGRFDNEYTSVASPDEVSTLRVSCVSFLGVPTMCAVINETTQTIRVENIVTEIVNRIVKEEVIKEVPIEKIVTRVETRYVRIGKEVDIQEIVEYIIARIKEYVPFDDIIDVPTDDIIDETTDYITNPPPPNEDKDDTTLGGIRDETPMPIPIPPPDEDKDKDNDGTADPNAKDDGMDNGPNTGGTENGNPDDGLNTGGTENGNPDDGLNTGGTENGDPNGGSNNGGTEDEGTDDDSNTGGTEDEGTDDDSNNGGTEDEGTDDDSNTGGTEDEGTDDDSNTGGTEDEGTDDDSNNSGTENDGTDDDSNNGGSEGGTPLGSTPGTDPNGDSNDDGSETDTTPWTPPEGGPTERLQVSIGPKRMAFPPPVSQPGVTIGITCQIGDETIHPRLDSFSVFRGDRWNLWGVSVWCDVPSNLSDSDTTIHVNASDFSRWCGLTTADIGITKYVQNPDGTSNSVGSMAAGIELSPDPMPVCNKFAPVFTDDSPTTRSVEENTVSGEPIGAPVSATDEDGDALTYTIGGTDGTFFGIDSATGQLKTSAPLNYEVKDSYSVLVTASDNKGGTAEITVAISVTDANDAPMFTEASPVDRSVGEHTASDVLFGAPVSATDEDGDTLTYTIALLVPDAFGIESTTGQLKTSAALDYETKYSYLATVYVSDNRGGTDSITLRIGVTDENDAPMFTEADPALRAIIESAASGANVGHAVSATDPDSSDTLEYSLSGTDASSFSINSSTGRLSTNTTFDYDTKSSYSVTVSVTDNNGGTDEITVNIEVLEFYVSKQEFFEVYYAIYLQYGYLEVQAYTIRGYGYDGTTPIYVNNYYKFENGSSEQTSTGWSGTLDTDAISEQLETWKGQYTTSDGYVHASTKVSLDEDTTADEARKAIYQTICNAAHTAGTWTDSSEGVTYPQIDNNTSDDILDVATILSYLEDDDCDPDN